jgi:hypothetical protein
MSEELRTDDPVALKKRRNFQKLHEEGSRDAFRTFLDTYYGRMFVYGLLEDMGVYRISFAGEATHTTAFNEGERNSGNKLVEKVCTLGEEYYILMRNEARDRAKQKPGK